MAISNRIMSNFRQPLTVIILAAGKGTRMHSQKPKVLHALAGKPLLHHVISCAKQLSPQKIIVVYGFGGVAVPTAFEDEDITWVKQADQLGTGHAVQQAVPHLSADGVSLVLLGDVPLINAGSCEELDRKSTRLNSSHYSASR